MHLLSLERGMFENFTFLQTITHKVVLPAPIHHRGEIIYPRIWLILVSFVGSCER